MSAVELSDDLVSKVQEQTGADDFERGVWQLMHQSRGRHVTDDEQ